MRRIVAVLDACVLVPIRLATTLLWLAEAGLFQALWSEAILGEVARHLPDVGVDPARAARRIEAMREAFGSEALVTGFDDIIDRMTCDRKDRHVLAAAVHAGADVIVTFNLKDFPSSSTAPHGLDAVHPDELLAGLLDGHPGVVLATLEREVAEFRNPPRSLEDLLTALRVVTPTFSARAAMQVASRRQRPER